MKRFFFLFLYFCSLSSVWGTPLNKAEVSPKTPLYFEADDYRTNFDTQLTTGKGNVKVRFEQRELNADHVVLDNKNQTLSANGNVVYKAGSLTATGQKMDIDLASGLGTFYEGTVKVENGVYIEGQKLEHYEKDRFRVIYGKVSTCMDCPQSWSLTGSSIDVEVEGYAEAHHALFQIRDMPVAYFPVFYFPVKQKRQSGFLIPQIEKDPDLGFGYHQSYFLAQSDHSDSTYDFKFMTSGGYKGGVEYRNKITDRTYFEGKLSGVQNQSIENVPDQRFGFRFDQRWQITPQWTQRARGEITKDPLYAQHFSEDITNGAFPSLTSEASLAWQNANSHFYLQSRFAKNNLAWVDTPPPGWVGIGDTHQIPKVAYGAPSYSLLGPLRASFNTEFANFYRPGATKDPDTNWIREGQRTTLVTRISSPLGLDYFKWEPSAEIRADGYTFDRTVKEGDAGRVRTFFNQYLEMDIWKVFDTGAEHLQALRQSFNPFVRWSYAPGEIRNHHPFFANDNSPKFDIFDPNSEISPVRLGTIGEEQRLREHHLATFGTELRLIARYGEKEKRNYNRLFTFGIDRDYDIGNQEWSRIKLRAVLSYGSWTLRSDASIDAKTKHTDTKTDLTYSRDPVAVSLLHYSSLTSELFGGGLSLSAIGPWSIAAETLYDTKLRSKTKESFGLFYLSPSKCWKASLKVNKAISDKGFRIQPFIGLTFSEGVDSSEF